MIRLALHPPLAHLLAALALVGATACKPTEEVPADESETSETEAGELDEPTWWRDVEPVVRQKCVGCHSPGNIGPFSLETHAEFRGLAPILVDAIDSGRMPPWPPDPDCNSYANDRSLTLEQEELLLTYIAGEMPEGTPDDAPPDGPPSPELVPDAVLEMAEAYTPINSPDDYRCFLVPWPEDIDEDRYVTGVEVYPGERSMVHHVIMFIVDPSAVANYQGLDDADPGPGYTCFGGPGMAGGAPPRWLAAWVPGVDPFFAPEGVGQRVAPGSVLVMQVHYHSTPGMNLADRSSIGVELATSVERPAVILPMTDLSWLASNGSMAIPAGDPDVMHETTLDHSHPILANLLAVGLQAPADAPLLIHDGGLHMHLFGKHGRLELRDAGGGNEQCIVDVPEWDFGWQSSYILEQPLLLTSYRELHLQCWWDNSAENQPIVDGEPLEPIDRDWGDGTLDEMCLGILYISRAP